MPRVAERPRRRIPVLVAVAVAVLFTLVIAAAGWSDDHRAGFLSGLFFGLR